MHLFSKPALAGVLAASAPFATAQTATQSTEGAPQRRALVIGVSEYLEASTFPSICTAREDAIRIATELRDRHNFQVTLMVEGTVETFARVTPARDVAAMRRSLRAFASDATSRDALLVYFVGRAYADERGAARLALRTSDVARAESTWSVDALGCTLALSAAQRKLLVIDGHEAKLDAPRARSARAGAFAKAHVVPISGAFVLTSASPAGVEAYARDGLAPFAHVFVQGLRGKADANADQTVRVAELARFVSRELARREVEIPAPTIVAQGVTREHSFHCAPQLPSWVTRIVAQAPNAHDVPHQSFRARIRATGLPWCVMDEQRRRYVLMPAGTFVPGGEASDRKPLRLERCCYITRGDVEGSAIDQWLDQQDPELRLGTKRRAPTLDADPKEIQRVEPISAGVAMRYRAATGLRLPSTAELRVAQRFSPAKSPLQPIGGPESWGGSSFGYARAGFRAVRDL